VFTASGRNDLIVADERRGGVMLLKNTTQPVFESSYPQVIATSSKTANVLVKSSSGGTAYAVCLPAGSATPASVQIKAGLNATGTTTAAGFKGSIVLNAHVPATISLSGLTPGAVYDIYVVFEDSLQTLPQVPNLLILAQPFTVPQLLTVTVTGSGTVYSSSATTGTPNDIICTSALCSANYPEGSTVTLSASPAWYATTSWGGVDSSSVNTATVAMNTTRAATANFVAAQNVLVSNPAGYFGSVKMALGAASDGATVKAKLMYFPDVIIINRPNTAVTLLGGLAQLTDTGPGGFSTIHGPLSITGGRLNIQGGIKVLP
jgi:hypothetical protein